MKSGNVRLLWTVIEITAWTVSQSVECQTLGMFSATGTCTRFLLTQSVCSDLQPRGHPERGGLWNLGRLRAVPTAT